MNKKNLSLFVLAGALGVFATGCSSVDRGTPISGFGRTYIQANFNRSDVEILGPVEGTSTKKSYFFGLVKVIDGDKYQILGIKFFEDQWAFSDTSSLSKVFGVSVEDRAYYKALAATPDADAVMNKSFTRAKTSFPPFYSSKEVTFQGKAIKYKSDAK